MNWLTELRRRRLATRVPERWRALYLAPSPHDRDRLAALELVALDLETTGLDPGRDRIVSAGWCLITGGALRMDRCAVMPVASERPVGDSALVHGLRDVDVGSGGDEAALLDALVPVLAGRVLLAHAASIEFGFIGALLHRLTGAPLLLPRVCTLTLEAQMRRRLGEPVPEGGLTLAACRKRHGLPEATAHEALADACACAELFLAQVQVLGGFDALRLRAVRV